MAQHTIVVGSVANDGTGDFIRDAFVKVNSNFDEIYADNFVTNARMADASVKAVELATTNTATSSEDNFVLSYDHSSGGFTWISQTTPDGGLIVANEADNRVITSSTAGNGNAEANLTFTGSALSVTGTVTSSGTLIAGGDGSSGGVTVADGQVDIRTGTGSVAKMKFYCESSNAHAQTLQAQPHSAASSAVLTLPSATGTLIGTGDSDSVTHSMLENRYTAIEVVSNTTGATAINWGNASVFKMNASLTGGIEFDFTGYKTGQIISIYNLTGSQTVTLDSDATGSETFNKVGGVDYAGGSTNLLQIECVDDSANAVFNYSVAAYVSDATPS